MILQKTVLLNKRIIKLILAKAELTSIDQLTGPDKTYAQCLTKDNAKAEVWLKST